MLNITIVPVFWTGLDNNTFLFSVANLLTNYNFSFLRKFPWFLAAAPPGRQFVGSSLLQLPFRETFSQGKHQDRIISLNKTIRFAVFLSNFNIVFSFFRTKIGWVVPSEHTFGFFTLLLHVFPQVSPDSFNIGFLLIAIAGNANPTFWYRTHFYGLLIHRLSLAFAMCRNRTIFLNSKNVYFVAPRGFTPLSPCFDTRALIVKLQSHFNCWRQS